MESIARRPPGAVFCTLHPQVPGHLGFLVWPLTLSDKAFGLGLRYETGVLFSEFSVHFFEPPNRLPHDPHLLKMICRGIVWRFGCLCGIKQQQGNVNTTTWFCSDLLAWGCVEVRSNSLEDVSYRLSHAFVLINFSHGVCNMQFIFWGSHGVCKL